jgi:hypothetical protein
MVKDNGNNPMMIAGIVGAVAFVVGLLIGWMLLGWVIAPVEWTDAAPEHLSSTNRVDYVQLVADSFVLTGDVAKAQQRVNQLGSTARETLDLALATTTGVENLRVSQLMTVVTAPAPAEAASGPMALLRSLLPICAALVLLLVVLGGGVFLYMRLAGGGTSGVRATTRTGSSIQQGSVATRVETPPDIMAEAGPEPVTTFKTTYMLGNDLFDESFSIDDQQGDFLGECGVGIGETIGVGDPKKVTAFEVWLFDKNDIRTVTKVLMSEHAFSDEGLKSRLSAKGEPALARSGGVVEMETATLKVAARIVDMQYGSGALPPNSFFQQLTLEISAWKKSDM